MKLEWAYLKLIRIQFILIIIAPIVIGIFLALKEGIFSWRLSVLLYSTGIYCKSQFTLS